MYFGFFGGSALLHLLAAHPKVVAALGVATTVGLLATSIGPQHYLGAGQQIRRLERTVTANELVDDVAVAAAGRRSQLAPVDLEATVRRVLRECGRGCADLTLNIVMNDRALLESALYVGELNLAAEQRRVPPDQIAQLLTRR